MSKIKAKYSQIKESYQKRKKSWLEKFNDELKELIKTDIGKLVLSFSLIMICLLLIPTMTPLYTIWGSWLGEIIQGGLYGGGIFGAIALAVILCILIIIVCIFFGIFLIIIVFAIINFGLKKLNVKVPRSRSQKITSIGASIGGALFGTLIGYIFVFPSLMGEASSFNIGGGTINFSQILSSVFQFASMSIGIGIFIWFSLALSFSYIFVLATDLIYYIYRKKKGIKTPETVPKIVKMERKQRNVLVGIFLIITLTLSIFWIYTSAFKPTVLRVNYLSSLDQFNIPENSTIRIRNVYFVISRYLTPSQAEAMFGDITDPASLLYIDTTYTIQSDLEYNTSIIPLIQFSMVSTHQIPRLYNLIGFGSEIRIRNSTYDYYDKFYWTYLNDAESFQFGFFSKFLTFNSFNYNETTGNFTIGYSLVDSFVISDLLYYP